MALSGCSLVDFTASKAPAATEAAAKDADAKEAGSKEAATNESTVPKDTSSDQDAETVLTDEEMDEAEIEEALFSSFAYSAQNEITTGLTTEFLDAICSYPVKVTHGDKETAVLKDVADLEKMGLNALYTDELLEAVGAADPEKIVIVDATAILGDPDGAYVLLGRDDTGAIGITEFHYPQ